MSLTAPSSRQSSPAVTANRAALTVVIPTLNESARIAGALADLSWASEVIVVDGGSTDDTVAIAREAGARVLVVCGETIAAQRNAGIAAAEYRWVLALDADERVTPELRGELSAIAASPRPRHTAYRMRFRNHYLGRELEHGPWGRDWHVRFFTHERRWITNRVHEHLEHVDGIGTLSGTILHYPYRDIVHHVAKIVKYAEWGAEDLRARGRTAGLAEIALRPGWRVFRDYILYSGWRDGIVGFIASALSGFAAFLKYAFLFEKNREAS